MKYCLLAATALCLADVGIALADHVTLTVNAVMATNGERQFDARLEPIRGHLKKLRFRNYQLVDQAVRVLGDGSDTCGIDLPGGRYLHIRATEMAPTRLKMTIVLNESNRPILDTDVMLDHNSVVLLGGPKDDQGTLLITIGADGDERRAHVLNETGAAALNASASNASASKATVAKAAQAAPKVNQPPVVGTGHDSATIGGAHAPKNQAGHDHSGHSHDGHSHDGHGHADHNNAGHKHADHDHADHNHAEADLEGQPGTDTLDTPTGTPGTAATPAAAEPK